MTTYTEACVRSQFSGCCDYKVYGFLFTCGLKGTIMQHSQIALVVYFLDLNCQNRTQVVVYLHQNVIPVHLCI